MGSVGGGLQFILVTSTEAYSPVDSVVWFACRYVRYIRAALGSLQSLTSNKKTKHHSNNSVCNNIARCNHDGHDKTKLGPKFILTYDTIYHYAAPSFSYLRSHVYSACMHAYRSYCCVFSIPQFFFRIYNLMDARVKTTRPSSRMSIQINVGVVTGGFSQAIDSNQQSVIQGRLHMCYCSAMLLLLLAD